MKPNRRNRTVSKWNLTEPNRTGRFLGLGEHGLLDAAVEAAKLELHSWQAAKLRSVGGALGGVRSAAAALCFQLLSPSDGSMHGPRICFKNDSRVLPTKEFLAQLAVHARIGLWP